MSPVSDVRRPRRRGAAAILTIAALICSTVAGSIPIAAIDATLAQRRIVVGDDAWSIGSVSPDGRSLAVIDTDGGVTIRDVERGWGAITRLRKASSANPVRGTAAWSPDSKHLAVNTATQILIVDVGTGISRPIYRIASGPEVDVRAWSPDGQQLLAASRDAPDTWSLLWLSIVNGTARRLPLAFIPEAVALSPNGEHIAVGGHATRVADAPPQLHVMTRDGLDVSLQPLPDFRPVGWTPDGSHLLALRASALWKLPIENGALRGAPALVAPNLGTVFHGIPVIWPLGITRSATLFYRNVTSTSDIYSASMDPNSGHLISTPLPLPLQQTGFNVLPRWSPDAHEILYHRVEWAPASNLIYSIEGRTDRVIAPGSSAAAMCWAHEGRTIVLTPFVGGNRVYDGTATLDMSTGIVAPGRAGDQGGVPLSCAGDLVTVSDAAGVVVRSLGSGSTRRLFTFPRPFTTRPTLSHDARTVAFIEEPNPSSTALMVIPTAGGGARELVHLNKPAEFQSLNFGVAWSPDDRFVFYLARDDRGQPYQLFRIARDGGLSEPVGLSGNELRDIDIAPDGRAIAFSIGAVDQPAIWALDVN